MTYENEVCIFKKITYNSRTGNGAVTVYKLLALKLQLSVLLHAA